MARERQAGEQAIASCRALLIGGAQTAGGCVTPANHVQGAIRTQWHPAIVERSSRPPSSSRPAPVAAVSMRLPRIPSCRPAARAAASRRLLLALLLFVAGVPAAPQEAPEPLRVYGAHGGPPRPPSSTARPVYASAPEALPDGERAFTLRHIYYHGTERYPGLLRQLDIHAHTLVATDSAPHELVPRPRYVAKARTLPQQRLRDRSRAAMEAHLAAVRTAERATSFAASAFVSEPVLQPNMSDRATILALAQITANTYTAVSGTGDWLDVGMPYNLSTPYGWESDSLRGHVFADATNSTVVLGIKGTSISALPGFGGGTEANDKRNDNLLFSCCCARVGYWWSTVCGCYADSAYTCDGTCLAAELRAENTYYRAALQLYYNVTQQYPGAHVWVAGHSLGGATASLLGQTYGLPTVAYESPGEALAADRLGLPAPPGQGRQGRDLAVWHVGHTADPLYVGACNGPLSLCAEAGFAFETRCHAGAECTYDTVGERGWGMSLSSHRILAVIRDVIAATDAAPECRWEPCAGDCFNWKFVDGRNGSRTTTSSAETTPPTSTTTCATPGWWGCRDVTTTAPAPTSPTSSGAVTTTTTGEEQPSTTSTTSTTSCATPGWWGCRDDATTTAPVATSPTRSEAVPTTGRQEPTSTPPTSSGTCASHGWFGQCLDPTSPSSETGASSSSLAVTTPPPVPPPGEL